MQDTARSTRREPRYGLRPGSSSVEFDHPAAIPAHRRVALVSVSVSGLAFAAEGADTRLPVGSFIEGAVVRVGDCVVRGDLVVRSERETDDGTVEIGNLFYPAPDYEDRWMVLNAGIEAAQFRPESVSRR